MAHFYGTMERRDYAKGTFLMVHMPWSLFIGGAAMCSDGKVRRLARIAETADTFFSIPAAVKVRGKTVSGYVTFDDDDSGARTVLFRSYHAMAREGD